MLHVGQVRGAALVGLPPDLFAGTSIDEFDGNLEFPVRGSEGASHNRTSMHLSSGGGWIYVGTLVAAGHARGDDLEAGHAREIVGECLGDAGAHVVEVRVPGAIDEWKHG